MTERVCRGPCLKKQIIKEADQAQGASFLHFLDFDPDSCEQFDKCSNQASALLQAAGTLFQSGLCNERGNCGASVEV